MTTLLTTLAATIVAASFYTIFGVGLALVYRVSRVLNFAHGVTGSVSGYITYSLLSHHMPIGLAAVLAILCGAALSGGMYLVLVRRIHSGSADAIGILTLGIAIVGQGILLWIYGPQQLALPNVVQSNVWFSIGAYGVSAQTVFAVGAAIAVVAVLSVWMYRTRSGLALRAASEGPLTASMFGINPRTVNTIVWMIAGALAALTALLVTPSNYLDPNFLTQYLIIVFAAVVLGGFENIFGVVIGAVVFGLVQSLVATYVTTELGSTTSFVVIVLVLFFRPQGVLGRSLPRVPEATIPRTIRSKFDRVVQFGRASRPVAKVGPARRASVRDSQWALVLPVLIIGVFLLIGPQLSNPDLLLLATIGAYLIATLGVDLLFGYSGQLSLGSSGFLLGGAYACVIVQRDLHVPFILGLVIAAVLCGVVGGILGWPVSRLAGVYLVVTTLAFALAVPELASYFGTFTGGPNGVVMAIPQSLASGTGRDLDLYRFVAIVALIITVPVMWLGRSTIGRAWKSVRENESAAAAAGVNIRLQKVAAFAVSSALCGLGGALIVALSGYLTPDSFSLWDSIYLVVAVVVGGRNSILGAAIGAAFVVGVPYASSSVPALPGVVLGAALIVTLILRPSGLRSLIVEPLLWLLDTVLGRSSSPPTHKEGRGVTLSGKDSDGPDGQPRDDRSISPVPGGGT